MKQALWLTALLLVAIVTAAMQLDRQSRYDPDWANIVPEPARYFAQAHVTVEALEEGDTRAALEAAETLLERRPVPAETMRLYAQTQLQAEETETGLVALQIAAQRGWRDPVTQEAMAQIAWSAGDAAASANRLAALYARESDTEVLQTLAQQVLSDPAGREQMAVLLAGPARWEARFIRQARHHMSAETFNAILLNADAKGADFTCGPLRDAARRQARNRKVEVDKTPLAPLLERHC